MTKDQRKRMIDLYVLVVGATACPPAGRDMSWQRWEDRRRFRWSTNRQRSRRSVGRAA